MITRAANPVQTVPDPLPTHLVPAEVGLAVFPGTEIGNDFREVLHERGRGAEPIAAVDQETQWGGVRNRFVVSDDSFIIRVGIVRRERENSADPGNGSVPGELGSDWSIDAYAGQHGHP